MNLVLTNNYPSSENLYSNMFVHRRVINYVENGINVDVFVLPHIKDKKEYFFEGIKVLCGNKEQLKVIINSGKYSTILIHFIIPEMIDVFEQAKLKPKLIIWFHGAEALSEWRRYFNYNLLNPRDAIRLLLTTYHSNCNLKKLRTFLGENSSRIKAIAVSEWMKQIVLSDVRCINLEWHIIPNVIDEKQFVFSEKKPEQRYKILTIRPFTTRKYANDLTINVIQRLSSTEVFEKLDIMIVGDGPLFNTLTSKVRKYGNVKILQGFLDQKEIYTLHKEYGIFLCPTRQDAQGVSMCEAMSSGLVPVTTNCSAIPEFVPIEGGMLCENAATMTKAIISLIEKPELFSKMSRSAAEFARGKCSITNTIAREIAVIKST